MVEKKAENAILLPRELHLGLRQKQAPLPSLVPQVP